MHNQADIESGQVAATGVAAVEHALHAVGSQILITVACDVGLPLVADGKKVPDTLLLGGCWVLGACLSIRRVLNCDIASERVFLPEFPA